MWILIAGQPYFREVATQLGVDFIHFNGSVGQYDVPEEMGPGCALFDWDNDGDLDIYLVQGAAIDGSGKQKDRLLINELAETSRFRDGTEEVGLQAYGFGMGVAIGDVDGNGYRDIYLLNYGPNELWLNRDGRSLEKRTDAGVADPGWGVSGSFFDYDRDGDLDLFVVNYIRYGFEQRKRCINVRGAIEYCGPGSFPDTVDRLYRNDGNGTFTDVSAESGILSVMGSGLGVVALDADRDGWLDVYIANDADPNRLWINQEGERFMESALLSGCALNANGRAEAGMGIAVGDLDGDGHEALIVTHLSGESHTVYETDGSGTFVDLTDRLGLSGPSRVSTGFGTGLLDVDNDGGLELLVVNGAVFTIDALRLAGDPYPLHQKNQLFTYLSGVGFKDVSQLAGPCLDQSDVSRGLAVGDIDNDGDLDALIANNNGPTRLWQNMVGQARNWIGFKVLTRGGGDALGARLVLKSLSGATQVGVVRTDGSYASARDPRVLFGLGTSDPAELVVYWPDGSLSRWDKLEKNRYHELRWP